MSDMTAEEQMFPIQIESYRPVSLIPWYVIAPHEAQAQVNHRQSIERLAERGGLSPCEFVAVVEDREWKPMKDGEALRQMVRCVEQAAAARAREDCAKFARNYLAANNHHDALPLVDAIRARGEGGGA